MELSIHDVKSITSTPIDENGSGYHCYIIIKTKKDKISISLYSDKREQLETQVNSWINAI